MNCALFNPHWDKTTQTTLSPESVLLLVVVTCRRASYAVGAPQCLFLRLDCIQTHTSYFAHHHARQDRTDRVRCADLVPPPDCLCRVCAISEHQHSIASLIATKARSLSLSLCSPHIRPCGRQTFQNPPVDHSEALGCSKRETRAIISSSPAHSEIEISFLKASNHPIGRSSMCV
jgi:hypothetical protein